MKYQIIVEEGSYALILRGNKMQEYAVVNGLDKETGEWAFTCSYFDFGPEFKSNQAEALMLALDIFLCKVRNHYISRIRLEELATKFKDGLMEMDEVAARDIYEEYDLEPHEAEWLGIAETDEQEYLLKISTYLENRITQCYKEELENYGKDYKGRFIGCQMSGDYLIIEYEECGKRMKTRIKDPKDCSLEQLYHFWQVDSFESARKESCLS